MVVLDEYTAALIIYTNMIDTYNAFKRLLMKQGVIWWTMLDLLYRTLLLWIISWRNKCMKACSMALLDVVFFFYTLFKYNCLRKKCNMCFLMCMWQEVTSVMMNQIGTYKTPRNGYIYLEFIHIERSHCQCHGCILWFLVTLCMLLSMLWPTNTKSRLSIHKQLG